MKRVLLLLLVIAAVSTACKKSKKATAIAKDALIGNWEDQLPLSSSLTPDTYAFRSDNSYSRGYGNTAETGTYLVNQSGSTSSTLDITLIPAGTPLPFRVMVEVTSQNRIIVNYNGSTAGRPFLRVP